MWFLSSGNDGNGDGQTVERGGRALPLLTPFLPSSSPVASWEGVVNPARLSLNIKVSEQAPQGSGQFVWESAPLGRGR